jgi:hydrogenase 3 maturation protease
MSSLKSQLKDFLKGVSSLAILGVGSELRGDDYAGMLVAHELAKHEKSSKVRMKVFFGETAPENLTGEIRKFNPSHLLIIDCADLGKEVGAIRFLNKENIGNFSFSTHKLPIKVMINFLLLDIKMDVGIIGIQPETIDFGCEPCKKIKEVALDVAAMINESIIEK